MTVVIVNYGLGNIGSLKNIMKRLGRETIVTNKPNDIAKAAKIILPGVGAFDRAMENLEKLKLIEVLNKKVLEEKTPVFGICLGMQIFADKSEEGVPCSGLGWISGKNVHFSFKNENKYLKIPHIGWNNVKETKKSAIFSNLDSESRFYFVHSYHMECESEADVAMTTTYGYEFVSAVQKDNIFGTQFHPEKSHHYGQALLERFLNV
ncbi:MAG: imidazole glycerol phosphate synthase subunit HisH [Alphaproteobacteria bacterium]|nr:imidazole glycerol phosphate synthase subunit HisH [Alphaproteobacteria bacterium]